MASLNGFDAIAKNYDQLASLIFGRSIKEAQCYFINAIPPDSNVLILGGGTGWLLDEILKAKPNCEIWYVDASSKMISLSKKNRTSYSNIHFIHGTENDIPTTQLYDVVITNFYLDLFSKQKLENVIDLIEMKLKPAFKWIVTDFIDSGKWWQVFLLKLMYRFFRIASKIDSVSLPDWSRLMREKNIKEENSITFFSGFIKTSIFIRSIV